MTADLAQAARLERDSRERNYPKSVASGTLTADEATIDFQAWHCIVHFLETGDFRSIDAGGIDERTVVGWAKAQAAADKAVASTAQALAAAQGDDAKVQRLTARLAQLRAIARAVTSQRGLIEAINRSFRDQRQQQQDKAA